MCKKLIKHFRSNISCKLSHPRQTSLLPRTSLAYFQRPQNTQDLGKFTLQQVQLNLLPEFRFMFAKHLGVVLILNLSFCKTETYVSNHKTYIQPLLVQVCLFYSNYPNMVLLEQINDYNFLFIQSNFTLSN